MDSACRLLVAGLALCANGHALAFTTTVRVLRASGEDLEVQREDNHERFEMKISSMRCDFATRIEVFKVGVGLLCFNASALGGAMEYDSAMDQAALFLLNSDSSGLGLASSGPLGRCGLEKVERADLTGCCSFHGGVESALDGRVICKDMTQSASCNQARYIRNSQEVLRLQVQETQRRVEELQKRSGSPKPP